MALLTKAIRGTQDALPRDSYKWQFVEDIMRQEAKLHGFREIRTPVFEHTELFQRSVGETTDVVQKEMYTCLLYTSSHHRPAAAAGGEQVA